MTRNQVTVFVNDIDADLNADQIKEDIAKARPRLEAVNVNIVSIKNSRNGSQTAIIEIEKSLKDTLIGDRGSRLTGWPINLGPTRAAHDAENLVIMEKNIDLLIVSEPNKKIVSNGEWVTDKNLDVAVRRINRKLSQGRSKDEKVSYALR
ncbi:hypothetical protein JTB14_035795 [Gonioctena quinquepunctata]|nr:hypothetical protein JTB14_035795 [Gonioctena quinquepunctata]